MTPKVLFVIFFFNGESISEIEHERSVSCGDVQINIFLMAISAILVLHAGEKHGGPVETLLQDKDVANRGDLQLSFGIAEHMHTGEPVAQRGHEDE